MDRDSHPHPHDPRHVSRPTRPRYRHWPAGTLVGGLLGFLYLINPLDLIPEALPVVGIVDDTLALGLFLALLSRDVKKYMVWKSSSENSNSPTTQKT